MAWLALIFYFSDQAIARPNLFLTDYLTQQLTLPASSKSLTMPPYPTLLTASPDF